jgi:hypothetical protein
MATHSDAVATVLVSGSYTHATKGTNLFTCPELPQVSVAATFCMDTGGSAPLRIIGTAKKALYNPTVQVLVRDEEVKFDTARTNARAAMAILAQNIPSGYVDINLMQSEPVYLGPNDKGWHRFVFNVRLTVEQN